MTDLFLLRMGTERIRWMRYWDKTMKVHFFGVFVPGIGSLISLNWRYQLPLLVYILLYNVAHIVLDSLLLQRSSLHRQLFLTWLNSSKWCIVPTLLYFLNFRCSFHRPIHHFLPILSSNLFLIVNYLSLNSDWSWWFKSHLPFILLPEDHKWNHIVH
jgi:uncharacterized membrane protein